MSKKPRFRRREYHRKSKLETKWRKPKGLHNKLRLKGKSYGIRPSTGYKTPTKERGLDKKGQELILITNIEQLTSIKKNQAIIIASKTGMKTTKKILEEAKKKGLIIKGRKPEEAIKKIEEKLKARKTERKKILGRRVQKKEEKKKETKKEEKTTEEEKKEEKDEKDKLLTKRQ